MINITFISFRTASKTLVKQRPKSDYDLYNDLLSREANTLSELPRVQEGRFEEERGKKGGQMFNSKGKK